MSDVIASSSISNLLILSSPADGDKHSYAMMVDIHQFAGVRLGPGTLYGTITRLEERGLIHPTAIMTTANPTRSPLRDAPRSKNNRPLSTAEPVPPSGD